MAEDWHRDEDHRALAAAAAGAAALCTVVGIEGSFSRRLGAQLAVLPDGTVAGSLADGCLEHQLAQDGLAASGPGVVRYGRGSATIDFRLPCGGGLDILIDPAPDRSACVDALADLEARREAALPLPANDQMALRHFIPALALRVFGEGPELEALVRIGRAAGITVEPYRKDDLTLGQASGLPPADRWTAVVLLFHDHEWERALLREALAGPAFYVGAQGGHQARAARIEGLKADGMSDEALARLRSPIGTPGGSRTPQALALAILAEVTGAYEQLRPCPA